jgi:glycosyltransferase involved in cell wall biosynthesis
VKPEAPDVQLRMARQDPSLALVSIITPAYNEEQYLAECIESVLAQTYTNWDYTIVNNCSSDATLAIAQKYADHDPRIHIISNSTLIPAIANFNFALRQVSPRSKYCKIVLADDWIFPECLERMVGTMEEHPSVGIVGAYGLVNPWVLWTGLPYPSHFVPGREVCRQRLLGGPYVFGSPTSLLFRSDLVRSHDPFYDESNIQADSETCFELLKDCDFGFVHQVLTYSRDDRPGSRLIDSRKLNTAAAGVLHELVKYGPHYLTPQEYHGRLRATTSKYYEFLAAVFLQRRNSEFWDYHRRALKQETAEFSYSRLLYAVLKKVLDRFHVKPEKEHWGL